ALPLTLLAEILGGGATSRLYRALVIEAKIADAAGAFYAGLSLDATRFSVYAQPTAGHSVEAVEAAALAEIRKLLAEGVNQGELDLAKTQFQTAAVYARDSAQGTGRMVALALSMGLTLDDIRQFPERIAAVAAAEILEAARAVLVPERAVTGILLPRKAG
ncbi:MAG: insulinase family protein, partial [Alphaproteobacteria bacterium]|nr:insulinase family protein [Alphaproteobacteria bacterium]